MLKTDEYENNSDMAALSSHTTTNAVFVRFPTATGLDIRKVYK